MIGLASTSARLNTLNLKASAPFLFRSPPPIVKGAGLGVGECPSSFVVLGSLVPLNNKETATLSCNGRLGDVGVSENRRP